MRYSCILLIAIFLPECSGDQRRALVIYSPHGKEMLTEFEQRYERLHPEVDVQWLDMGSQDAYDRIRTERENPQADVWWGAPMVTFAKAEQESLLQSYRPSWERAVAEEFKSTGGNWFGTFVTPEVIMYNNRILNVTDAPKDWDDLLDPRWKDKIIIRYPLASGTMRIIFSALIERAKERTGDLRAGFQWLRRLDANTKTYVADPTQLYLKIARGEGAVTLWNLPDVVLQTKVNGYPFAYVIPLSGTPLLTDCIAIVNGTKNLAEAKRFYEFVTSKESLIEQAHRFYRIPARGDIPAGELPGWIASLHLTPMKIDWTTVVANEQEWMKKWDAEVKGSRQ